MVKWVELPDGTGRYHVYRLDAIVGVVDCSSAYEDDEEREVDEPPVSNIASYLLVQSYGYDPFRDGWIGAHKDDVLRFLMVAEQRDEILQRFK